jgi:hypothetical protein
MADEKVVAELKPEFVGERLGKIDGNEVVAVEPEAQ